MTQSVVRQNGFNEPIIIWISTHQPFTAAVAWWLERPPREWEVVGSIHGLDRLKSLKLVVAAFPLGAQDYGNSTATGPLVSG